MNKVKKILTTLVAATLTVSTGLTSMPMFAHNVKAESKAETISSDTNDMSQYKKINGISSQTVLGADFSHYQLQKNAWKKVWKNYKGIEVSNVFEYVRSQGINPVTVYILFCHSTGNSLFCQKRKQNLICPCKVSINLNPPYKRRKQKDQTDCDDRSCKKKLPSTVFMYKKRDSSFLGDPYLCPALPDHWSQSAEIPDADIHLICPFCRSQIPEKNPLITAKI